MNMVNKFIKRSVTMLLICTMVLGLVACGAGNSDKGAEATQAAASSAQASTAAAASTAAEAVKPIEKVTMLCNYTAAEVPNDEDTGFLKQIEDYTGTKVEVTWIPNSAYNEKVNTLISSQSLPEITVIRKPRESGIVNAARSGMLWEVSPYLPATKNLSQINATIYKNIQIDGKEYMIPRTRDLARAGGIFRKDWLDNLGLKMPTTLDEAYEILKAFTNNDPDKNGKKDTYGFALVSDELARHSTLVSVYMGGPNKWYADESGNIVPEFYNDTYTESLNWFKKAYSEGLVNKDWPVCKDNLPNFTSGACGMLWFGNIEDTTTRIVDLYGAFPNATVDTFQILTAGSNTEQRLPAYEGYNGAMVFSKTAIKDEERLKGVIAFVDKLGDPDMVDLYNWGIKDKSYTVEGDKVVQTADQVKVYGTEYNDYRQMTPFYTSRNMIAKNLPEINVKVRSLMDSDAQYVINDPTLPFISNSYVEMGGELDSYIDDAKTKYVIGEIDLNGWKAAIEDWKKMGGEKVIQEYTEQYKASK